MPNEQHSDLSQPPEIQRQAYDDAARAVRVLPKAFTGSEFVDLSATVDGELNVNIVSVSDAVDVTVAFIDGVAITDTFTGTGNGSETTISTISGKYHSLSVRPTGGITSWDVRLEVSNDGNTWTEVAAHTNVAPGAGLLVFNSTPKPAVLARHRCHALDLGAGTNIIASSQVVH